MRSPSKMQVLGAIIAGLACAFLAAGLTTAVRKEGLGSSDTAGWVQAIGATLALVIAVWAPIKQRLDAVALAETARKEGERRVCLALRDELALLSDRFTNPNVTELLKDAPGEFFERQISIPMQRFPVFNAMVARLTEIEDEGIRRGVIEAYGVATEMVGLAAANNRHLTEYSAMRLQQNFQPEFAVELAKKKFALVGIRRQMQVACRLTIEKVGNVLPLLNEAVGANRPL